MTSLPGSDSAGVEEERRGVVALEQVLSRSRPGSSRRRRRRRRVVGARAGEDEVVTRRRRTPRCPAGRRSMKSLPSPPMRMSTPGPPSIESLPAPPLRTSSPPCVGDGVAAVAAQGDVVTGVAFDAVVARAAPERVVVEAAGDAVDARGAVVDALAVDARGIDGVELAVLDRAVGLAQEQLALVAVRVRVVGTAAPVSVERGGGAGEVPELEAAVGRAEGVRLERVRAIRVALDQLGERVRPRAGPAGSGRACGSGSTGGRRPAGSPASSRRRS